MQNSEQNLGNPVLQLSQQAQENQQQNISTNTSNSPTLQLTENEAAEIVNLNDSHIGNSVPGILDNVLNPEEKVSIFNTSSDTVNKLLRGLSSTSESDSIRKLSEETAGVLPSFAKALGQPRGGLSFTQPKVKNSYVSGTCYRLLSDLSTAFKYLV